MRLKEIEERLAQIKLDMDVEGADISAISDEADKLIEERNAIITAQQQRSALLEKIASGTEGAPVQGFVPVEGGEQVQNETEKRASEFVKNNRLEIGSMESRSLLVSSGNIAIPTKVSALQDIKASVSSIVDMAWVEDCNGMGADNVPYTSAESEASAGTEGAAAATSEGTFGVVTISPAKYNLVSYVSADVTALSPVNYLAKVQAQAFKALRRKASEVLTSAVKASTITREVTDITTIGADTLRKIVLGHGSDNDVEGGAVLFLNKADLIAFGDVRGEKEKKAVYEITPDGANPNIGIIKDGGLIVKYCLNSSCDALTGGTNTSTTATKPTMFYGNPKCLKLDLFSPYTVKTSEDYKFAEGLLSVLGSMLIGAAVVVKDGFTVVSIPKKSA